MQKLISLYSEDQGMFSLDFLLMDMRVFLSQLIIFILIFIQVKWC